MLGWQQLPLNPLAEIPPLASRSRPPSIAHRWRKTRIGSGRLVGRELTDRCEAVFGVCTPQYDVAQSGGFALKAITP
jgi:hypothetical protein